AGRGAAGQPRPGRAGALRSRADDARRRAGRRVNGAFMLLRFALRGVLRHGRRSLLTGAALAGGIVVLVVLAGLQDGYVAGRLEDGLGMQLGHLRVTGGARPLPDPIALADAFVSDGTAVAAAPRFRQPALLSAGGKAQGALVLGVDP